MAAILSRERWVNMMTAFDFFKVELTVTCYHTHGSKTRSKQVTYKKTEEFKYTRCVDSSGCVNTSLFSGGSLTRVSRCIDFLLFFKLKLDAIKPKQQ